MVIVIIVIGKSEAKMLFVLELYYGGVIKKIEKYWELGPSSVCITCWGIGHKRMGKCGSCPSKYVICADIHKLDKHQYGIDRCNKESRKICTYLVV